jgi:hypothetical protein
MSTKITKRTIAILGIPLFKVTTETRELPNFGERKVPIKTTEIPKPQHKPSCDPNISAWSSEANARALGR